MLLGSMDLLNNIGNTIDTTNLSKEQVDVLNNVAKEAFCLHVRNIAEFFYKSDPKQNKNTAKTFANSNYIPASESTINKTALNMQISHLIYGRPDTNANEINDGERTKYLKWIQKEIDRWKSSLDNNFNHINIRSIKPAEVTELITSSSSHGATNAIGIIR
jgi:hypothetical protein